MDVGSCFGEEELISNKYKRSYSIICDSDYGELYIFEK